MSCKVPRLTRPPQIDADWDKRPWLDIRPEPVRNHMGSRPSHFPRTEVKIAYDAAAIYVIFRVEDRYVRAVAAEHQDSVCRDSCVELFFTPDTDVAKGYFNLEMNCGGTMLFAFQKRRGIEHVSIPKEECSRLERAHSLPRLVNPEIAEPVTWTVEYRVPLALLQRYCRVVAPAPGVVWRANFYKCASDCSHPHYLTWARVDAPEPDFHLPEFFGELEFE